MAGICVGCPCQTGRPAPAGRGLGVDEVTYLRRIFTAISSVGLRGDYGEGYRDGIAHALNCIDELLAEKSLDSGERPGAS